jgi:hypothetical protein
VARFSKKSLEGYLKIDHTAGGAPRLDPGLVAAFEHRHGPLIGAGVEGVFEAGTLTCCHCQAQMVVNPKRVRPRNWCGRCDRYVCDNAACILECKPVNAVLDHLQNSAVSRSFI